MSSQAYAKLLTFSDYHGSNIFLNDSGTTCNGQYLKAHGQFITRAPLRRNETFDLEFRGTGIVKFNTFQYRAQAVQWVQSKQPLPKGCRRVRMKGITSYIATVSCLEDCVRVESKQRLKIEVFILSTGPETTLAFDIECGDVVVAIFNTTASYVTFDTCNVSPNVEITCSQRIFKASLEHYNPSALCCLENTCLEPGSIFMLEVRHLGLSRDSGSYMRVCSSVSRNPYINDRWIQCCGTPVCPLFKGKRVRIEKDTTEILRIRVLPEGLAIDRRNKRGLDMLLCPTTAGFTLWFELHKVSLKVWQIVDYDNQRCERDINKSELNGEATLPTKPPPVCRPRQNRNTTCTHEVHPQLSEEGNETLPQTNHAALQKEAPILENKCASYVSPDSWDLSNIHNATNSNLASSTTSTLSRSNMNQPDLTCNAYEDMYAHTSIGHDLVTLSSLESMYDSGACEQNPSRSQAANNSHYEKPGRIWSKNKAKPCQTGYCNGKRVANKKVHGKSFLTLNTKQRTLSALKAESSTQSPSIHADSCFTVKTGFNTVSSKSHRHIKERLKGVCMDAAHKDWSQTVKDSNIGSFQENDVKQTSSGTADLEINDLRNSSAVMGSNGIVQNSGTNSPGRSNHIVQDSRTSSPGRSNHIVRDSRTSSPGRSNHIVQDSRTSSPGRSNHIVQGSRANCPGRGSHIVQNSRTNSPGVNNPIVQDTRRNSPMRLTPIAENRKINSPFNKSSKTNMVESNMTNGQPDFLDTSSTSDENLIIHGSSELKGHVADVRDRQSCEHISENLKKAVIRKHKDTKVWRYTCMGQAPNVHALTLPLNTTVHHMPKGSSVGLAVCSNKNHAASEEEEDESEDNYYTDATEISETTSSCTCINDNNEGNEFSETEVESDYSACKLRDLNNDKCSDYTDDKFSDHTDDKFSDHTDDKFSDYTDDKFSDYTDDKCSDYTDDKFSDHTDDKFSDHTDDKFSDQGSRKVRRIKADRKVSNTICNSLSIVQLSNGVNNSSSFLRSDTIDGTFDTCSLSSKQETRSSRLFYQL